MQTSSDTPLVCDHTSVGMLVFRSGKLLLIDRKKPPLGYAQPAGHVDDHGDFEQAAIKELEEETGLHATSLRLLRAGRRENGCRRPDGTWHEWKMYRVDADGEVKTSDDEVKSYFWCSREELTDIMEGTHSKKLTDVSRDWFNDLNLLTLWDKI